MIEGIIFRCGDTVYKRQCRINEIAIAISNTFYVGFCPMLAPLGIVILEKILIQDLASSKKFHFHTLN